MGQYDMLFPFEYVQMDARILIYGAGKTGVHYLRQLRLSNYCKVVGFIDRDISDANFYAVPTYSMKDALRLPFDYIVIAVQDSLSVHDIIEDLKSEGVTDSKIVWIGKREDVSCVCDSDVKEFRDFTLNSGERQVGTDLSKIRKDHIYRYQMAINFLKQNSGNFGLDFFCGTGYGTYYMSTELHQTFLIGIDASMEAIQFANQYYSTDRTLFCNKYYPFCLPKGMFDFIVSFESIEHINDGKALFQSLIEAVKPGGYLIFSVPNERMQSLVINKNQFHFKHYTWSEVVQLCANQLEIITWYGQNVYKINNGKTNGLLDEKEMHLQEHIEGQVHVVICQRKETGGIHEKGSETSTLLV